MLAAVPTGCGTLLDGAAAMLARGMLETLSSSGPAALSQLTRAAAMLEPVARTVLLPDTPAALTAVVALQCGELSAAQTVLQRALAQQHGGHAAVPRHRLLQGWVLMARGRIDLARRTLTAATAVPLEPRDELTAAALAVALARRAHDTTALTAAWARARDALLRQPVDLTTLAQLGELAVATAQLGEDDWLTAHLDEADALLARLGDPPLWSMPLQWYRLQAALAAGRADEVDARAGALVARAGASPYAGVLAAAAHCWTQVLAEQVDVDEVVAAGRRMQAVGLGWEAAQLLGRAAPLAGDRRAVAGLHAAARALDAAGDPAAADPSPGTEDVPDVAPVIPEQAAAPAADGDQPGFTERELEIGQYILAGPDLQADRAAAVPVGQDRRAPRGADAPAARRRLARRTVRAAARRAGARGSRLTRPGHSPGSGPPARRPDGREQPLARPHDHPARVGRGAGQHRVLRPPLPAGQRASARRRAGRPEGRRPAARAASAIPAPCSPSSVCASAASSSGSITACDRSAPSSRSSTNSWAPAKIRSTSAASGPPSFAGTSSSTCSTRQQRRAGLEQVAAPDELRVEDALQVVQPAAVEQLRGQRRGAVDALADQRPCPAAARTTRTGPAGARGRPRAARRRRPGAGTGPRSAGRPPAPPAAGGRARRAR